MVVVCREELAWAAGFFDGEGSTSFVKKGRKSLRRCVNLGIMQTGSPETLERFQVAVGGIGRINGPYHHRNPVWAPFWKFASQRFEHVQAIIAMLWPFLSAAKKEQAARVLIQSSQNRREV